MSDEGPARIAPGNEPGPFIAAAVLCERVLDESSGIKSAIRIFDTLTLGHGGGSEEPPPTAVPVGAQSMFLLLTLRPAEIPSKFDVTIRHHPPSGGERQDDKVVPVSMGEDSLGSTIVGNMSGLQLAEGLHWFDVLVDDRVLTRLPLRVRYVTTTTS